MPGTEEHRRISCGFSWVANIPYSSFWHNLYHNIQDTLLQTMWRCIFNAFSFFKSFRFFLLLMKSWFPGSRVQCSRTKGEKHCKPSPLFPHQHGPARAMAEGLCSTPHPTTQLQPGPDGFLETLTYTHHFTSLRNPTETSEVDWAPNANCLLRWRFKNLQQEFHHVNQRVRSVRVKENLKKKDLLQLLVLCSNTSCLAPGLWKFKDALLRIEKYTQTIYILYAIFAPW